MTRLKRRQPKWISGLFLILCVGGASLLVSLNTNANPPGPTVKPVSLTIPEKAKLKRHHALWKDNFEKKNSPRQISP